MSRPDDSLTVRDMLDHTIEAINIIAPLTRDDLDSDRITYLALLQLCQIIGEAATRLSQETRDAHPDVPWREIIAFRNKLIHGYDTIDRDILWAILANDFPTLRAELASILSDDTNN